MTFTKYPLEPWHFSDQEWTRALLEPDDEAPPEEWQEDDDVDPEMPDPTQTDN